MKFNRFIFFRNIFRQRIEYKNIGVYNVNTSMLKLSHSSEYTVEIGIDEVGRGPLFGRVYAAAVILPPAGTPGFRPELLKDSKKFTSAKKIEEAAQHIREYAVAYSIQYAEHTLIDQINILQATFNCMHRCIDDILTQSAVEDKSSVDKSSVDKSSVLLLVDGNLFKPYSVGGGAYLPHCCVKSGDATYASIAAASILAKVARDKYIEELCDTYPELNEKYGIASNKGYGSKQHIAGIKLYGQTQWHRKSFVLKK